MDRTFSNGTGGQKKTGPEGWTRDNPHSPPKPRPQAVAGKKMWCVGELDDEYIEKMEDVLSVYERPYSAAQPVVCLDEKPVSLHADVRPARPMVPGHSIRRDNEYKRNGTANIFAVVEPKAGRHFTRATPDRSGLQFALLVRDIVTGYPFARTIHLVMDNLNIHRKKSLTDHLGPAQADYLSGRLRVHYTLNTEAGSTRPKSSSA